MRVQQIVPDWRHFAEGAIYGNPMIADIQASKIVKADDMVDAMVSELERQLGSASARLPLEATVDTAR